jgi:hypothetical protein
MGQEYEFLGVYKPAGFLNKPIAGKAAKTLGILVINFYGEIHVAGYSGHAIQC